MRFFMLYSNQFAIGNKPIGIASLAAILKKAGHEFELFDCTSYNVLRPNKMDWNSAGEGKLEFKIVSNPERLPARLDVTYQGLMDELVRSVDGFKPDLIGLSALTDDYPLGLGLMRGVKQYFPQIPTIAGGVHPSVDPGGVLSEDCFDLVCVGEGEYVVLDIAERVDQGRGFEGIRNLWVRQPDGSVERNAVRPYETNLDVFPFPDWSIYPEVAFYKPFQGYVYKYGDFEMSRGCPYKCSYCINVHLQEVYKGYQYHREKSIPRVIAEIKYAMKQADIEFLKFWDETFLLMSKKRMEGFCDLYSREIGLPYVIETTGQIVNEVSVKILQKTNCRSASLGMETGSPDMRKGLLHKPTDNAVYVKAFKLLEEHGIQKAAFNMLGLPTESQEDIFRTIGLNRMVQTEVQAVGIFYPYKGTPIREMMVRDGWMDEDFDLTDLKDYDFNTFTAGNRSVVRFKDMDSRIVSMLKTLFATYVIWPAKLYPLIDHVKNKDGDFVDSLFANIQRISYFKKFGEWRPREEVSDHAIAEAPTVYFNDSETDEFAALLVKNWRGGGFDEMISMLQSIATGTLKPEFEMPTTVEGLTEWLEVDLQDESVLKQTRDELRGMAKAYSAVFASGTYVPTASGSSELSHVDEHPVQPATQ